LIGKQRVFFALRKRCAAPRSRFWGLRRRRVRLPRLLRLLLGLMVVPAMAVVVSGVVDEGENVAMLTP